MKNIRLTFGNFFQQCFGNRNVHVHGIFLSKFNFFEIYLYLYINFWILAINILTFDQIFSPVLSELRSTLPEELLREKGFSERDNSFDNFSRSLAEFFMKKIEKFVGGLSNLPSTSLLEIFDD